MTDIEKMVHLLERLKGLVQQWDYHATTCKVCATWDREHKQAPCEIGLALVHEILELIE